MDALAAGLLVVAAVLAVVDWFAVARGARRLEYVAKPGATIAVGAMAVAVDTVHTDTQVLFVVALVASLIGDVFLLLPGDRFVPGLASFLVAQVLFAVGFALHGGDTTAYVVAAVVVALLVVPLALRFVRALRASHRGGLVVPVVVYMTAISAMALTAIATTDVWAIVGALAFVASDSLIAETRFVRPHRGAGVAIMVTYHLALIALVLSLL